MLNFKWDENKNLWLKANRGIDFHDVVLSILTGGLIDVMKNTEK